MKTNISNIGPHKVLKVEGNIDLYNVEELKKVLNAAIDDTVKSFIVDMEGISYLDSSGIGTLLGGHKKLKKMGRRLYLVNMIDEVLDVFKLSSLDLFFHIYNGEDPNYSYIPHPDQIPKKPAKVKKDKVEEKISNHIDLQATQYTKEVLSAEKLIFSQPKKHSDRIIFKGWVDPNTFRIPGTGIPRQGTIDILKRKIEAKDNAIRKARYLALDHFVRYCKSKNWLAFIRYQKRIRDNYSDIVKTGIAKLTKFDSKQNCTVILEIKKEGLKRQLRKDVNPEKYK
jgi:anti-sigma B factor antagonist